MEDPIGKYKKEGIQRINSPIIIRYKKLIDSKEEVFHIAHTFHNLTESLVEDFKEFNEEAFWLRVIYLEKNYKLLHYRRIIEESIKKDI